MPISLPYLATNKNISTLFEKISSAKIPEVFTHSFLQTTIGLKGTNDRSLIPLLKSLGFLDQSNIPTQSYRLLKGHNAKPAIAQGIKLAYGQLFDADQTANKLSPEKLKSLVAQVAGTDDGATSPICNTFLALVKSADFETDVVNGNGVKNVDQDGTESDESEVESEPAARKRDDGNLYKKPSSGNLRPEFHYNIQVHLPSNSSEETYLNIFNALRKAFQ